MKRLELGVGGMSCAACSARVERALKGVGGVESASVNLAAERANIVYDENVTDEAALKKAGSPVESLYVKNEGHGFYNLANQRTYYSRLLAFLSRSLGGATAGEAVPAGSGKAP